MTLGRRTITRYRFTVQKPLKKDTRWLSCTATLRLPAVPLISMAYCQPTMFFTKLLKLHMVGRHGLKPVFIFLIRLEMAGAPLMSVRTYAPAWQRPKAGNGLLV